MLFIRLRLLRHRRLGDESTQLFATRREKPEPEPLEISASREAVPRGSPAPPAAIDKSQTIA